MEVTVAVAKVIFLGFVMIVTVATESDKEKLLQTLFALVVVNT